MLPTKFRFIWPSGFRGEDLNAIFYPNMPTILSGTSSSIKTKVWWNRHWMVLFQNGVRQLRYPAKMAATVQLRCYWKQLWSRWAITGSWEPLVFVSVHVLIIRLICSCERQNFQICQYHLLVSSIYPVKWQEKFEHTKGVIRSHRSKKERKYLNIP
jgi:hypothetical protein